MRPLLIATGRVRLRADWAPAVHRPGPGGSGRNRAPGRPPAAPGGLGRRTPGRVGRGSGRDRAAPADSGRLGRSASLSSRVISRLSLGR